MDIDCLELSFECLSWKDHLLLLGLVIFWDFFKVLRQVCLGFLLLELMKGSDEDVSWTYLYGAGICLSQLGESLCLHQFMYHAALNTLRWKSGTIALVYQRILRFRQADFTNITRGHVINLIASDLQRFEPVGEKLVLILGVFFNCCSHSFLMVYLFGWKAMSGIFFLLTLSFYYGIAGRWCVSLRSKISNVADKRVNLMNSIISGIRTVKMHAWEWSFMERVLQARSNEMKLIRWEAAILATFDTLYFSCNTIAAFISFTTMVLNGVELNSYNTFMILSLLSSIKTHVTWTVAQGAKELADFAKALCRIQDLLEYDYSSAQKFLHGAFANCKKGKSFKENNANTISLQNVVCSWNGRWERPSLKSVSLTADKGDLLFITGPVGCGKSSIFYAILSEMSLLVGDITYYGKIAWISQQPWVFSGTVRENILFGETFDPKKYGKTLWACDLHKDLERLPFGDMTRVGERGIVLSELHQHLIA
ncbi:ATP-binding cassette sub-family C member 4-like [Montipora capricornis]|uniref:ATP-binding cassette sub-family C member 4-like n=1 Tax=Montipora capricornis TaxID=246305 RepID=UPI0035F1F50D